MSYNDNDFVILIDAGAGSGPSAGSTSAPAPTPTMDWRQAVDRLAYNTVDVFTVGEGPNTIHYLLKAAASAHDIEQVDDDALAHYSCAACVERTSMMVALEGPDGPVFMQGIGDELK